MGELCLRASGAADHENLYHLQLDLRGPGRRSGLAFNKTRRPRHGHDIGAN